jgi:hypothetical protein
MVTIGPVWAWFGHSFGHNFQPGLLGYCQYQNKEIKPMHPAFPLLAALLVAGCATAPSTPESKGIRFVERPELVAGCARLEAFDSPTVTVLYSASRETPIPASGITWARNRAAEHPAADTVLVAGSRAIFAPYRYQHSFFSYRCF